MDTKIVGLTEDSDKPEELDHQPISCHMFRSQFIAAWLAEVGMNTVLEDRVHKAMLKHTALETDCIYVEGEVPSSHTINVRTKIKVHGVPYHLPKVARGANRNVQPYHYYMYGSGQFSREELSRMTREKDGNPIGASHTCGGSCMNHTNPEPNTTNQARKPHHADMVTALESKTVADYLQLRATCDHEPKCFINPAARRIGASVTSNNRQLYDKIRLQLAQEAYEIHANDGDDEDEGDGEW